MVIISVAAAIWLIWRPQRTRTFWPRGSSVAISATCIFGCLTSLLVISAYKMEMKRVYLLADLIVQNRISDSFQADWRPDLKILWPSLTDPQHALDRALDARAHKPVLLTSQSKKCATWSMEQQNWYFCTVADTVGVRSEERNIDR